jgi:hypothetical protein
VNQQSIAILAAMAAATALFLAVSAVLRRARRLQEERAMRAMERGWTYTQARRTGTTYVLEGSAEGFRWRLETRAGQKGRSSAEWTSADLASGGAVVGVMNRAQAALFKSPMAKKLAQWGLAVAPRADPRVGAFERLLDGCVEVDTGDAEFHKAFGVLATEEEPAKRLLGGEARQVLVEWNGATRRRAGGGTLSVSWSEAGLSVTWGAGLEDPDAMVRFAELGVRLGKAAAGRW